MSEAHPKQILLQSWLRLGEALVFLDADLALHRQLIARYEESQRKYHTVQHLLECIEKLEPVLALAVNPGEVEIALWFHDAIYAVNASDNEYQSAVWARETLTRSGLAEEQTDRICDLVLATRHNALPATSDQQLLVDIDLAILGADEARFDEYEDQIRQEYAWVPELEFRQKRSAILDTFITRPSIYCTPYFREALEKSARANLRRSIERLRA